MRDMEDISVHLDSCDYGFLKWFFNEARSFLSEDEFYEDYMSEASLLISASEPVSGEYSVPVEELDIYRSLGEELPFFWESFDSLFSWALERPGVQIQEGS